MIAADSFVWIDCFTRVETRETVLFGGVLGVKMSQRAFL